MRNVELKFKKDRILVILGVTGILSLSYFYAPYADHGPVVCLMHGLLGLPCPACGLTRAFCYIARLRFLDALKMNALGFPLFAFFLGALVVAAYELIVKRRLGFYRFIYSTRVAMCAGAVLILYHVTRVVVMYFNGTLATQYWQTSWTYAVLKHFFH